MTLREVRLPETGRKRLEQPADKPVLHDIGPEDAMNAANAWLFVGLRHPLSLSERALRAGPPTTLKAGRARHWQIPGVFPLSETGQSVDASPRLFKIFAGEPHGTGISGAAQPKRGTHPAPRRDRPVALALLAERHIRRLAQLDLIHGVDGEVWLTEIGRKRYEQLPDKPVLRDSAPEQAMNAALAKIADDPSG